MIESSIGLAWAFRCVAAASLAGMVVFNVFMRRLSRQGIRYPAARGDASPPEGHCGLTLAGDIIAHYIGDAPRLA